MVSSINLVGGEQRLTTVNFNKHGWRGTVVYSINLVGGEQPSINTVFC